MKSQLPPSTIYGLAVKLPDQAVSQQEAVEHALAFCAGTDKQRQVLSEIYRRTGIATRCSALAADERTGSAQRFFSKESLTGPSTAVRMQRYAEEAPRVALAVAESALFDAALAASEITHLVTASCTGFSAPGFDIDLILGLPLPPTVQRTHVGFMGCHGALNALRVANALAQTNDCNRVLVCCVELCSLHFQYGWNSNNIVANSLFSDGAAAGVIGTPSPARGNIATLMDSHSIVLPDTKNLMSWRIGDHGFQMTLSSAVPDVVSRALPDLVQSWLSTHALRIEEIKGWAIHPGGPRIVGAVEDCLGLDLEAMAPSRAALAAYGNMSSPTVLFILDALRAAGQQFLPCVMMAFGPGLTVELALLT